eukprot:g40307.t1
MASSEIRLLLRGMYLVLFLLPVAVWSATNGLGVLITEVLYDAPTPNKDAVEEWIELYNPLSSLVFQCALQLCSEPGYGMTLEVGNSGDMVRLRHNTSAELDFVSWENWKSLGWTVSARDQSIRRKSAIDTDQASDWESSGGMWEIPVLASMACTLRTKRYAR